MHSHSSSESVTVSSPQVAESYATCCHYILIHLKDWHTRESMSTKKKKLKTSLTVSMWRCTQMNDPELSKEQNIIGWVHILHLFLSNFVNNIIASKMYRFQKGFGPRKPLSALSLSVSACLCLSSTWRGARALIWPSPEPISAGIKSPAVICCSDKGQTADCVELALSNYAPHETARQPNDTPH